MFDSLVTCDMCSNCMCTSPHISKVSHTKAGEFTNDKQFVNVDSKVCI